MSIFCESDRLDPFVCPDRWTILRQLFRLLPRGRAWQTHSSADGFAVDESPSIDDLTIMQRYWLAFAILLEFFYGRACGLLEEFFCTSAVETQAGWRREYGFPDPCEHYNDVCQKMAAVGGARCEDYVAIAATRGWAVECVSCADMPAARAGCGNRFGDGGRFGCGCDEDAIHINVDLDASPAYANHSNNLLGGGGRFGCGNRAGCGPSIGDMACLIERIRHAHLKVYYTTTGGE